MGTTTEQLAVLLAGLSNQDEVFAVSGERDATTLAEHVHALAATGEQRWEADIDPRTRPVPLSEVGSALQPVPRDLAERRLAGLASRSLVYTYDIMDAERARELAGQLVALLGEDAEWWSSQDPADDSMSSPVSRCTVDAVVAGANATHFAALLQLGED
ncbi:hypothetical protein [Amycolatopsis solani]|uniref:hypothetical protein n=1 Tax=Amycolatopsis solani TaxID=3028615 RepID=UPI0025AFE78C|nr:hypothetical protein [Amycolatopsis sp. MEP2-6]